MRNLLSIFILLLVCSGMAHAEYFDKRFKPGYDLLEQKEFEQALESFEQLKIDNPESELVDYSIATVDYQRALDKLEALQVDSPDGDQPPHIDADVSLQHPAIIEHFTTAKRQFNLVRQSSNPFLRENAPLNAANCTSQIAKLYHPQQQYKERVDGLRQALNEYENYLGQYPDHKVAKKNRNHVSFLLKQLLRNPPEEQEQQDGEEDDPEENEEQDDQQQQDSENEDESEEDQEQQDEDESNESDSDEEDGDSSEQQPSDSQQNQSESTQPQEGDNGKSPEKQNIEAILESLEAKNQEEQRSLRRSRTAPRVKGGKWW